MTVHTAGNTSIVRVRITEITLAIVLAAIVAALVVMAIPAMPFGAVVGGLTFIVVAFVTERALRVARTAYLAD